MVLDAFIAASQVELWGSTGRPVIGVFHTASAGNEGQAVPGKVGPAAAACGARPAVDKTAARALAVSRQMAIRCLTSLIIVSLRSTSEHSEIRWARLSRWSSSPGASRAGAKIAIHACRRASTTPEVHGRS